MNRQCPFSFNGKLVCETTYVETYKNLVVEAGLCLYYTDLNQFILIIKQFTSLEHFTDFLCINTFGSADDVFHWLQQKGMPEKLLNQLLEVIEREGV